jgi:hypothetical protein
MARNVSKIRDVQPARPKPQDDDSTRRYPFEQAVIAPLASRYRSISLNRL